MKYEVLLLLGVASCSFCTDYSRRANLLQATETGFSRIAEYQATIRTYNLRVEKERAAVIKFLRRQQTLIATACADTNKLISTADNQVKRNFEQVLLSVCAIITHMFKNILYKTFNDSFFAAACQTLDFCKEAHITKLSAWASSGSAVHITTQLVQTLIDGIDELKQTLRYIPENFS